MYLYIFKIIARVNIMTKTKLRSILSGPLKLVAASVLLVCMAVLVFSVLSNRNTQAESGNEIPNVAADLNAEGKPYLDIVSTNVSYEDSFHIAYAVRDALDADMNAAEIKMAFWKGWQSDFTLSNSPNFTNKSDGVIQDEKHPSVDGCLLFYSNGIAAKEMAEVIYCRAYIEDSEGNVYYSNVVKSGIVEYVYSKFNDAKTENNVTAEQLDLYQKILDYGANAQNILSYNTERPANAKAVRIQVENGVLTDGFTTGVYFVGDTVTMVADPGRFSGWKDSAGEVISTETKYTLEITDDLITSGNYALITLKASYGEDETQTGSVKVINGSINGGKNYGIYSVGDELTINADDRTAEKYVFSHWVDEANNRIENADLVYTVEAGANKVYTAVYHAPSIVTIEDENGTSTYVYPYGADYTVMANAPAKHMFKNWQDQAGNILYDEEDKEMPASFSEKADGSSVYYKAVYEKMPDTADSRYDNVGSVIYGDSLTALQTMDNSLFSEDVYLWLADLYDPESGAFYFSISGKENYGYLPDIETTSQASGVLDSLGLGTISSLYTDEQKATLLSWVQSLQSNRDGYYYHPQWSISIGDARRSRDYTYSSTLFDASGIYKYRLFDDANYRLSGGANGNGINGVTEAAEYDKSTASAVSCAYSLTSPLNTPRVSAVSKVILVSASANSSVPSHLLSEEDFVDYLNARWNSTCKETGTHERHICTSSCTWVEDEKDSYMIMDAGKVSFVRGYRCEKGHTCNHDKGHSYGFGSINGTQLSQIKAVGLGDVIVNYYYDIQENVQESLRNQDKAPNGLWEEEVTYGTISGLLKIYGTFGTFDKPFLYAEEAIKSALDCALTDTTEYGNESIVSIYNPFNAISGVLGNLNDPTNYGLEENAPLPQENISTINRCVALIRRNAAALIENATEKLALYKDTGIDERDGGFSYDQDGYCTTSQGQPVAVDMWRNGIGEGDVNGTALAFGTRSALLKVLLWGVQYTGEDGKLYNATVGAPFAGENNEKDGGFDLNGNGTSTDQIDLNNDGIADFDEATCTHSQRFQYIIQTKSQIAKTDTTEAAEYKYTFESDSDLTAPSSGTVENGALKVVDNDSNSGVTTKFDMIGNAYGEENVTKIHFDMYSANTNTTDVPYQFFGNASGGYTLFIDVYYGNSLFTFVNRYYDSEAKEYKTQTIDISVDSTKAFTVDISVYPEGKTVWDENGAKRTIYGIFEVTQGENSLGSVELSGLYRYEPIASFSTLSLKSALTTAYYDNVSVTKVSKAGATDGEYHFDTNAQDISDALMQNPATSSYDMVYPLTGNTAFAAYQYATNDYVASSVNYNFNAAQIGMLIKDANAGDSIELAMLDSAGKKITGITIEVGSNTDGKTLTFCGPDGKVLTRTVQTIEKKNSKEYYAKYTQSPMVLNVTDDKWVTVKFEYHYDLDVPQLDVVVRYADSKENKYISASASVTKVDVEDSDANPYKYSNLSVNSTGKVYLDDLFVRNVYHDYNCGNTHVYIEKAATRYETGEYEFDHIQYYKSCQKCGIIDKTQTFVVHTFMQTAKGDCRVSEATLDSPAIYKESCSVCGTQSDKTFTYGFPIIDPDKCNYEEKDEGKTVYPTGVKSTVTTENGGFDTEGSLWAVVRKEEIDKTVNYYLEIGKKNVTGSNKLTFNSPDAGADRYLYEFDFQWHEASDHLTDIILTKVCSPYEEGGTYRVHEAVKASADGTYVTYYGVRMNAGEWHSIKYFFEKVDGTWTGKVYIDGKLAKSYTMTGFTSGTPYVLYETRNANVVDSENPDAKNNLSFGIDRIKISSGDAAVVKSVSYEAELEEGVLPYSDSEKKKMTGERATV